MVAATLIVSENRWALLSPWGADASLDECGEIVPTCLEDCTVRRVNRGEGRDCFALSLYLDNPADRAELLSKLPTPVVAAINRIDRMQW